MKTRRFFAPAVAVALALPVAAPAATVGSDSPVAGVPGAELSLTAATPTAMTLTHAAASTATSLVTVTSTSPSWTLSIKDGAATTPGQLDKVDCISRAPLGGSLANPLQWSLNGTNFFNLSGTDATVTTGTLVEAHTITYMQALGATEDVALNDCYELTATYTAVG